MGKHKHFKFMAFLNILDEAEIHTITKTWEKWISIIREKYGKKCKHSKVMGFSNILGEAQIHTTPKIWGKWNPIVRKKIWENTSISKLSVSEILHLKQKSMQFAKHEKSGFPLYGKSMGKHKHFKFMGFLNSSDEAEIHTIPRIWEKWIPVIREKYGKRTNIPK